MHRTYMYKKQKLEYIDRIAIHKVYYSISLWRLDRECIYIDLHS